MMRSFGKTKQAGELESLKAVEDNLSFTPEEEQYLDTLSGMFKDGVPSDDGLMRCKRRLLTSRVSRMSTATWSSSSHR